MLRTNDGERFWSALSASCRSPAHVSTGTSALSLVGALTSVGPEELGRPAEEETWRQLCRAAHAPMNSRRERVNAAPAEVRASAGGSTTGSRCSRSRCRRRVAVNGGAAGPRKCAVNPASSSPTAPVCPALALAFAPCAAAASRSPGLVMRALRSAVLLSWCER